MVAAALWVPTCMLVGSPPVGLNNGRAYRGFLRSVVGAILALALSICARATGAAWAASATRDESVTRDHIHPATGYSPAVVLAGAGVDHDCTSEYDERLSES